MTSPAPDTDDYVTQKTRRIMARAALRKISRLVTAWEDEEQLKALRARQISLLIGSLAAALFVVYPLLLFAFSAHPKVQLFTASVLVGIVAGIGLVAWPHFVARFSPEPQPDKAVSSDHKPAP